MQNSMVISTFPVYERKYTFWANLVQKIKICQFRLNFGTYTNSNMQDSMKMFTFSVFYKKYLFWANLIQNIKFVSLSWNLVPRLVQICRIQWWCSLFCFLPEIIFWGNWSKKSKLAVYAEIWHLDLLEYEEFNGDVFFCFRLEVSFCGRNLFKKIKILYWSSNLEPRLIQICRIQLWSSFFYFLKLEITFWINLVQKFKIVILTKNLVPTLFQICKVWWWCSYFLS